MAVKILAAPKVRTIEEMGDWGGKEGEALTEWTVKLSTFIATAKIYMEEIDDDMFRLFKLWDSRDQISDHGDRILTRTSARWGEAFQNG